MAEKQVELRKLVKRIGETGEFIHVQEARCNGCGNCVRICPMNLWGMRKGKAVVSRDYSGKCVECGSCWVVCDGNAIEFSYPKGGTGVTWEFG